MTIDRKGNGINTPKESKIKAHLLNKKNLSAPDINIESMSPKDFFDTLKVGEIISTKELSKLSNKVERFFHEYTEEEEEGVLTGNITIEIFENGNLHGSTRSIRLTGISGFEKFSIDSIDNSQPLGIRVVNTPGVGYEDVSNAAHRINSIDIEEISYKKDEFSIGSVMREDVGIIFPHIDIKKISDQQMEEIASLMTGDFDGGDDFCDSVRRAGAQIL